MALFICSGEKNQIMKKLIFLLILSATMFVAVAQVAPTGQTNPQQNQYWSRSGNIYNGSTPVGSNILGFSSDYNSPIYIETYGLYRMKISSTFSSTTQYSINGFGWANGVNTSGYVGIGANDNVNGGQLWTNKGPFSLLHLNGDNNTGWVQEFGYRTWMKTGITITSNDDLMYVGPKKNANDVTDAVFLWSDNSTSTYGPDNMLFLFTNNTGSGNNDLNGDHPNGREIMRLTAIGNVGIGPRFNNSQQPQSTLHINQENYADSWLQVTNQNQTGQLATDGFRIGIEGGTGNANLRQQENQAMIFYTNYGHATSGGGTDWERMRITHIGAPNVPAPAGIPLNTTRVSINQDGDYPITYPRSLMHIGYNTGTILNGWSTADGWRDWMNVGMFVCEYTDHIYLGMKNENYGAGDLSDAVICWGDNHHQDLQYPLGQGPDNLRFIFTGYPGATGVDPRITSNDGLEVGRFTPDGHFGIGDFTIAGLNEQPTQSLDVDSNARIRQMPITTNIFDVVTIDGDGVLWRNQGGINGNQFFECEVSNTAAELPYDSWIRLHNHNYIFEGNEEGADVNNVGIGLYDCTPKAKLEVLQQSYEMATKGILVTNYDNTDGAASRAIGIQSVTERIRTIAGWFQVPSSDYTAVYVPQDGGKITIGYDVNNAEGSYGPALLDINGDLNVMGDGFIPGGVWTGSDSSIKVNMQPINNAYYLLKQVKPYTFHYIQGIDNIPLPAGNQYGFSAQQVQNIFPELVKAKTINEMQDSSGNVIAPERTILTINETKFIPIIVSAMIELEKRNDSIMMAMNDRLNQLEAMLDKCCNSTNKNLVNPSGNDLTVTEVELSNRMAVVLDQNVPNPFAENTMINYFIPEDIKYAQIIFSDNYGKILKTVDITTSGYGVLKVYAANLSSGMYTYSIIVDGKVIDTKKMVCTK